MSERSQAMQGVLDGLLKSMLGVSNTEAGNKSICVICRQPAVEFRTDLSRKEYGISRMCQICQDKVFRTE